MTDRLSRLQYRLARLEAKDYRHKDRQEIEQLRHQIATIRIRYYEHPGRRMDVSNNAARPGYSDDSRGADS